MRNIIFYILLSLLVSNCGFNPIYETKNISDYKISINEIDGEIYINNLIRNEINRISNKNAQIVYKINVKTNLIKTIILKDSKGTAAEYRLTLQATFTIESNGKTETISFSEQQNLKNIQNIADQKQYENTIKRNFVKSMVNKLNFKLIKK